jgi:hypothetical protein
VSVGRFALLAGGYLDAASDRVDVFDASAP